MFNLYKKYLESLDKVLRKEFKSQKPFIKCQKGCSFCCEVGDYPFSRLEMEYLMAGLLTLDVEAQKKIKAEIKRLLKEKLSYNGQFMHRCPFLAEEKTCFLYERRGIVCRTFGLASFENSEKGVYVKLPECVKKKLNYSEVFDGKEVVVENFKNFGVESPVNHSLNLNYYERNLPNEFKDLEFGEIRPMLDWFSQK